jgi:hypothetical protein
VPQIVGIEQRDPLATGPQDPGISCGGWARIPLANICNPIDKWPQLFPRVIRAAIVNHDYFQGLICLFKRGQYGISNEPSLVICGDDD